jgi:hypothetical protein
LIPCKERSEQTVDLLIPKGDIQASVDKISNINNAISILNWVNPEPITRITASLATKIIGLATYSLQESNIDEVNALYNLKIEVVVDEEENFVADERINEDKCGAEVINFG